MTPAASKTTKSAPELLAIALAHSRAGNAGLAAAVYRQVLDQQPKNTSALRGLATALLREGKAQESLIFVDRAIAAEPTALELKIFRAQVLDKLGRPADVLDAYSAVLKKQPTHAGALYARGRVLFTLGRAAEAIIDLEKARDAAPTSADVFSDLGSAYAESGRTMEALDAFERAVALNPQSTIAQFNRANTLRKLLRLDEAMAGYRRTLELDPQLLPALIDLTEMLGEHGDFEGALVLSDRALSVAPQNAHARQVRALLMLRHSHLKEGFPSLDWRLKPSLHMVASRPHPWPKWEGQALAGKSILIWTEQGIGDEIITAGMFNEVIAQAEHCIIECAPRLVTLFARSFPATKVVAQNTPPDAAVRGPFDFQSAAWSLAQHLRTDFASFPQHGGYLKADPERVTALRAKYQAAHPGKSLIGLSWDSHARHGQAKRIPLDLWSDILKVPQAAFFDLQYKPANTTTSDASVVITDPEIEPMADMDAAAAQIAAMDLVITISNTTAHLAGALGTPAWVLVPEGAASFWYWFRDRNDSPWYPSLRLFRQKRAGDWPAVMTDVAAALKEFKA